jgi:diadenosine tetraphosphatase ApaH/serine/threonine PP2A family protein phosphatase
VRRLSAGLAVNPGSVGKPKDGDPRASYALLHLPSRPREEPWAEIVRVDYDLETEAALLEQAGLPPETVRRLRQGR